MKSFDEYFHEAASAVHAAAPRLDNGACVSDEGERCTLCYASALCYEDETGVRQRALKEFWKHEVPDVQVEPLIPAAQGRGYRTVSKRKVFRTRTGLRLGLIDPASERRFSRLTG